jgi:CDP-diacylglycerol--glycerol-3-phosphate 3-phosphatidyltransferase
MRVSANQVTIARLLGMPVVATLIYGDEQLRILGVVVGTLIGLTDFVDGYLARKQGVTVLGSLLDPVADKVFVVASYIPYADGGAIPWWAVAAIMSRELVVTVLRSSLELGGQRLPSSRLAKIKTWVQMVGLGLLVLIPILDRRGALPLLFAVPLALVLVAVVLVRFVTGRALSGLWFAAGVLAGLLATAMSAPAGVAEMLLLALIVAITWVSAWDYFVVGLPALWRVADHRVRHWLRVVGGALLPVLALGAMGAGVAPGVAVVVLLSAETARGAVDNYIAHRRIADFSWAATLWSEIALLVLAAAIPEVATQAAIAAAALASVTCLAVVAHQLRLHATSPATSK